MRAVIQRVSESSVCVDGRTVGAIGPGLMVLLGMARGDDEARAAKLAEKLVNYRIFRDDQGRPWSVRRTVRLPGRVRRYMTCRYCGKRVRTLERIDRHFDDQEGEDPTNTGAESGARSHT